MNSSVNVLGTEYKIIIKKYNECEVFKEGLDGLCDRITKEILLCDMTTYPQWEKEPIERCLTAQCETLKHEIVHAFLNESGLCENALQYGSSWSQNEEMVDWIALQGEKIYKAWLESGAIS